MRKNENEYLTLVFNTFKKNYHKKSFGFYKFFVKHKRMFYTMFVFAAVIPAIWAFGLTTPSEKTVQVYLIYLYANMGIGVITGVDHYLIGLAYKQTIKDINAIYQMDTCTIEDVRRSIRTIGEDKL